MPHMRLIALALAATALVMTGCGGSSTKSSGQTRAQTSSNRLTASQSSSMPAATAPAATGPAAAGLIAKADTICKQLSTNTGAITITSPRQLARVAGTVAKLYRTAYSELSRLTPPAAMARDWQAILADYQPLAGDAILLGKYARDNDQASVAAVEKTIAGIQENRVAIARHDGFKDCTEP